MTNFLPIFPLNIVTYPTETVSLHIFEPRYKQLVHDCFTKQIPFGMPIIINGVLQKKSTVLQITSIVKEYPTGEMDIRALGLHTCLLLEVLAEVPNKLYSGAIVTHDPAPSFPSIHTQPSMIEKLFKLHQLLEVDKKYKKPNDALTSFDIAHHVGLNSLQEYELLNLPSEKQRQQYLLLHLEQIVLTVEQKQKTKERILLNGHFRNIQPEDFIFTPFKK